MARRRRSGLLLRAFEPAFQSRKQVHRFDGRHRGDLCVEEFAAVTGPTHEQLAAGMTTESKESRTIAGRDVTYFNPGNVAFQRSVLDGLDGYDEYLEIGSSRDVAHRMAREGYAVGWDGEWRNHHQGGAAGYAGREWIGTPESDERVVLPQGYAWNPTVQGAKSEDTHLVTDDGIEVLSGTGGWPTERVEAVGYDDALTRHAVLDR